MCSVALLESQGSRFFVFHDFTIRNTVHPFQAGRNRVGYHRPREWYHEQSAGNH